MTVLRPGDVAVTADRMSWGILNCLNCTPTRDGAGGGAGTGSMVDLFQVFGARPDAEEVVVISKVPTFAERSAVPSADTSSAAAQPPVGKPPLGPPGAAAPLLENSSPRRGVLSYSPSFVQIQRGQVAVAPMCIVERCCCCWLASKCDVILRGHARHVRACCASSRTISALQDQGQSAGETTRPIRILVPEFDASTTHDEGQQEE